MATATLSADRPRIFKRSQLRLAPSARPLPTEEPRPALARPIEVAKPVVMNSPAPAPTPVKDRLHVLSHPVSKHALTLLCNEKTSQYEFRLTCNQLLNLLAIEATRTMPVVEEAVNTSKGPWHGHSLAESAVFVSVEKDGLSMLYHLADSLSGVLVASIGAERSGASHSLEPRLNLSSVPALSRSRVVLFSPVVISAEATLKAVNLVQKLGANDVAVAAFMMSAQAIFNLKSSFPNMDIWTAGVDSNWDGKNEQMHLLSDFGVRFFP